MKDTLRKRNKLSSDEVSVFCTQVAMLISSGITLSEGVYILYTEMEHRPTKSILKQIDEALRLGDEFNEALKKTDVFPEYMIHMIKIGETTGKLQKVLEALSEFYERESQIKASIQNAIRYPFILFAMMSVVLLILVYRILPLFESMFLELSIDVAVATDNMIYFGINTGKAMAITVGILFVCTLILSLWYWTPSGKRNMDRIFQRMSFSKKLVEMMDTGKFISSMALMVASGMDTREALALAYDSSQNQVVHNKIEKSLEYIDGGMSLDEALRESTLLVGMEGRLVSIAAKSGASDTMFAKLSEQYNQKTTLTLNKISSYIDTTLVISLSVMVGTVLITVMIPLINMISSIG